MQLKRYDRSAQMCHIYGNAHHDDAGMPFVVLRGVDMSGVAESKHCVIGADYADY